MASEDLSETEVVECLETESDEECEETQQQTNSMQLVQKKNTKSKVWKYHIAQNSSGRIWRIANHSPIFYPTKFIYIFVKSSTTR